MKLWRRFARDRRGVAAVEFALIAPVMVLLYCGLVELCQALIAERKASHVASSVGDLVARAEKVSTSEISDIFSIGNTIMQPFSTGSLKMRVTSFVADANGTPKQEWSRSHGGAVSQPAAAALSKITLAPGESVIVSQSEYTYTSLFQYVLPNGLTYADTYLLRPRRTDKVICTGC